MNVFQVKMRLIASLAALCCFVCCCCVAPAVLAQTPRGTIVSITGESESGPPNNTTTYTYTLTSGPALQLGENILITGMANPGNNGMFTIIGLGPGLAFTVVNPSGTGSTDVGTGTVAFNPESGALLEIDGTGAFATTHVKVYDSQIHTGNIVTVTAAAQTNGSNCNAADLIPTDAYLQQAAAPTGCDDGDVAESGLTFTNTNAPNKGSFTFGPPNFSVPFPPFNITSQYVCLRNAATATISAASLNGGTTTYTYTLNNGSPALQVFDVVIITGMTDGGNNGTFGITALHADGSTTFDVANSNGVSTNDTVQNGTAIVGACSSTATNITAATRNTDPNPNTTTYTYTVTVGPPLNITLLPNFETVNISCFTDTLSNNNGGPFTINALGAGTFTATNPNGTTTTATTINNITAATNNGDGTTTYTYTSVSGPALQSPNVACPAEPVTISGMTDPGNNGTFKITVPPPTSTTVTLANASGVTTGTTQNGTGTATQVGSGTAAMSNHDGTVFSNDTGFLTVTNTSGSAFTGTIKLSGNSPNCGTLSDMVDDTVNGLGAGKSVVLALSNDSSSCGGYNASQTQTLAAGTTSIFPIGNDAYRIAPFDSLDQDALTVLPIPVPAGPLSMSGKYGTTPKTETPLFSPWRFRATNFSPPLSPTTQDCIAYDDLSAPLNPVCLELQVSCFNPTVNAGLGGTCADALTYLYFSELDYTKDQNSLGNIGGNAFLGEHSGTPAGYPGQCPTTNFNLNVFLSYTPTPPDGTKGGGTGSNCYVGTFDPNAAGIALGNTLTQKTLVGFQLPVRDCTGTFPAPCGNIYFINKGKSLPLTWQTFSDSAGTVPVTNLNFCPRADGTTNGTTPCGTPWVFVGTSQVNCLSDIPTSSAIQPAAKGSSGFRNLGPLPQGTGSAPAGTYTYNLDTGLVTTTTGCFTPVLGFSTGFWSFGVAEIEFK